MTAAPFRVAVAGGGFGAAVHVAGFRAVPGVEVVALAASTQASAALAAARAGVPVACAGIGALLDRPLDAVSFALPPDANPEAVAAALDRGLAVLSEKPLAPNGTDAHRLAVLAADVTTAVDFEFAELESFRALAAAIHDGSIGPVQSVDIVWRVESYAQRHRDWSWKTDAQRGGGVIGVLTTHLLYLIEWLFGPVVVTEAQLDSQATAAFAPPGAEPAAEAAALKLTTEAGVPVRIAVTNAAPGEHLHRWAVAFDGGQATLENSSADYMGGFTLILRDPSGDVAHRAEEPAVDGDGRLPPFIQLARRFVTAAREGGPCTPDFAAGARVQALVDDIHAIAVRG